MEDNCNLCCDRIHKAGVLWLQWLPWHYVVPVGLIAQALQDNGWLGPDARSCWLSLAWKNKDCMLQSHHDMVTCSSGLCKTHVYHEQGQIVPEQGLVVELGW